MSWICPICGHPFSETDTCVVAPCSVCIGCGDSLTLDEIRVLDREGWTKEAFEHIKQGRQTRGLKEE
jgi:hypothetical protein